MVHPKTTPEHAATLPSNTKIITVSKLDELTTAVKKYAVAIGKEGYGDVKVVSRQLQQFGLTHDGILSRYTVNARQS